LGGLTPSPALISECCKNLSIPVFVLIRPRPGDFYYNPDEYRLILDDIKYCKEAGAAGSGITPENALEILSYTGCTELHFSAKHTIKGGMEYQNTYVCENELERAGYSHFETSENIVKAIVMEVETARSNR
jgi:copper homeostasis protein CutC